MVMLISYWGWALKSVDKRKVNCIQKKMVFGRDGLKINIVRYLLQSYEKAQGTKLILYK